MAHSDNKEFIKWAKRIIESAFLFVNFYYTLYVYVCINYMNKTIKSQAGAVQVMRDSLPVILNLSLEPEIKMNLYMSLLEPIWSYVINYRYSITNCLSHQHCIKIQLNVGLIKNNRDGAS